MIKKNENQPYLKKTAKDTLFLLAKRTEINFSISLNVENSKNYI